MFSARSLPRNARVFARVSAQSRRSALSGPARFQSTAAAGSPPSSVASHAAAGIAGGAVVLLGVYSYYHFSGAKKVVDGLKSAKDSFVQSKNKLIEKTPDKNAILRFMRDNAKAYGIFIPGASTYIDSTFDSLDEVASTHSQEVDRILNEAYEELRPVIQDDTVNAQTAAKVFDILRRRIMELQKVATKAGSDFLGPFFEKNPELRNSLGTAYDEFLRLTKNAAPEARRVISDTTKQITSTFENGINEQSIARVKEILQDATSRVQSAGKDAAGGGQEAWNKATEAAKPYLDQLPEIKDLLTSKATVLMSSAGAPEIWARVKDLGQRKGKASKEKVEEVKAFINEKIEEAEEGSTDVWDKLEEFTSNMPGASIVSQAAPQMKEFVVVLREDTDEARQLAEETFSDVMSVLKEKAEKGKKLSGKAKEDAENSTTGKKGKK